MTKLPVELQPGETIVLRCRRHPVFLVSRVVLALLAAAVPIGLVLWLSLRVLELENVPRTIVFGVCALWAAFWLVRAYFAWYQHQHDEWIVSNQRLIDIYKKNPFNQQLATADLVNVQNINVRKEGLFSSLFNYGNVECQTAGQNSTFVLSAIPDPAHALSAIDAARDAARIDIESGGRYMMRPPDLREGPA